MRKQKTAMIFRIVSAAMIAMWLGIAAQQPADAQDSKLVWKRAEHLRRGINMSHWFAQSPGNYSVQRLRSFTTVDDVALVRKLGFDHIRIGIDPAPLEAWQAKRADGVAFMGELDTIVRKAHSEQLAVVLVLQPEGEYKRAMWSRADGIQRFVGLWRSLAVHFGNTDPNDVFFEIMNEPEIADVSQWQRVQTLAGKEIRGVAPHHTIIASGAVWSGLDDLVRLEPIGIDNVIYTFHSYEPFVFTHQGATWTDPLVKPLRDVPYPSSPEAIERNLNQETSLAGKLYVEQYGLASWNAQHIDRLLAFAEQWSKLNRVPVYCGEFGVYRVFASQGSRFRWIRDTRMSLEKHHIGWAMWDYQDNFGVVRKSNGRAYPDVTTLNALGLR